MAFSLEQQYQQYMYPETMYTAQYEQLNPYSMSNNNESNNDRLYNTAPKRGKLIASKPVAKKNTVKIKMFILNKPSQLNKQLFKFLRSDIEHLNKKKDFEFEWIIVYEDEMEYYEEQNMTEFPCIMFNQQCIAGTNAIINTLRGKKIENNSKMDGGELNSYLMKEINNIENDEDLDESDIFAQSLTARMAEMNKIRNKNGQHAGRVSNQEIHERTGSNIMKRPGQQRIPQRQHQKTQNPRDQNRCQMQRDNNLQNNKLEETPAASIPTAAEIVEATAKHGDMDDDLMQKFWQNNEETPDY